jgi:hypothetical protein
MRRWLPPLEGRPAADRDAAPAAPGRHRDRGLRLRQAAAGLLGALLHGAPLRPEQGRLPVQVPRPPEGMTLRTREGQPFLTINGIQTMSAQTYSLLPQVPELLAMGIEAVRISPQPQAMAAIVAAFDAARVANAVAPDTAAGPAKAWSTATGSALPASPATSRRRRQSERKCVHEPGFFDSPFQTTPAGRFAIGAHLPQWPHSLALATALNAAARVGLLPSRQPGAARRTAASSSRCSTPAGRLLHLSRWPLPAAVDSPGAPDLCSAPTCRLFCNCSLARRTRTPCSSSRELSIVGDTELGLLIKNMLDAVELPQLPRLPPFAPRLP